MFSVYFRHPVAAGFHVLFKLLAFGVYILFWIVSSSFVLNFMDFWTTKNVSGNNPLALFSSKCV